MKDTTQFKTWLSLLITIALIAFVLLLLRADVPEKNNDVIMFLLGAFATIVRDIYSYYFGSSEGSAIKTEMLKTGGGDNVQQAPPVDQQ